HLKAQLSSFRIDQRLDERMSGREPLTFELALDPVEEDFELRFTMGEPIELFGLAGQVLIADVVLDGIECLDLDERLFNAGGLGLKRALKMAAAMSPALGVSQSGLLGIALVGGVAVG